MVERIADGKVVAIRYRLSLDDGRVISESGADTLDYLHGSGNIVPGLETQLAGRSVGETVDATVAPEQAYGERDPMRVEEVPRSAFPAGIDLVPGMQLAAQDQHGNVKPLTVRSLTAETVTVDLNHPLAGETLHFSVDVISVRDATAEEIAHGHAHGPGGHQH